VTINSRENCQAIMRIPVETVLWQGHSEVSQSSLIIDTNLY
jgi:hypothetical protein